MPRKEPFIVRDVGSAIFGIEKCYPLIEAPPLFWVPDIVLTNIGFISLIIDRFSIPNHRFKARKLSFCCMVSDLTLLLPPVPLLGRSRYFFPWHNVRLALIYLSCIVRLTQIRDRSVVHLILWSKCRKLDQAFSE